MAHKPGKLDDDGIPHEKTEKHIVEYLKPILEPPDDHEELNKMHEDDESTHWFGVAGDPAQKSSSKPNFTFLDHKRYETLTSEHLPPEGKTAHPRLISFIGQTSEHKTLHMAFRD